MISDCRLNTKCSIRREQPKVVSSVRGRASIRREEIFDFRLPVEHEVPIRREQPKVVSSVRGRASIRREDLSESRLSSNEERSSEFRLSAKHSGRKSSIRHKEIFDFRLPVEHEVFDKVPFS